MKAVHIVAFTALLFVLTSSYTNNIRQVSSSYYSSGVQTSLGFFEWCPSRASVPQECTPFSAFKQIPFCAYTKTGQFFDTNFCDVCSTTNVQAKREGYCVGSTQNPTYPNPTQPVPINCRYGTTQVQMNDGSRGCVQTVIPNCQIYYQRSNGRIVCGVCSAHAETISASRFTQSQYGSTGLGVGCPYAYLNLGRNCDGVTLSSYGQYECTSPAYPGNPTNPDLYCPYGQKKGYFIPSRCDICLDQSEFVVNCPEYDDYGQGVQCACPNNLLNLENGTLICTSTPKDYSCKYWKKYDSTSEYVTCGAYCSGGQFAVQMIDGSIGCTSVLVPNCNTYEDNRGCVVCRTCEPFGVRTVWASDFTHPVYGSYNSGVGCPTYSSSAASCGKVVLENGNYYCD